MRHSHTGNEVGRSGMTAFSPSLLEQPAEPHETTAVAQDMAGSGTTETIDVSVCIANWNCRELLRECLRSLDEEQQGVRLEVIVVDNASHDGSAVMVESEFPHVRLIKNEENFGFARANNQAAACARGRYLFFLNNDTVVPPGTLFELYDFAEAHPEVGLLGPRLVSPDGSVQVSYRRQPTVGTLLLRTTVLRWANRIVAGYRRYRRAEFDPSRIREVPVLMGAAVLIPRRRFQELGGWDETFRFGAEDIELSIRVGERYRVVFLPDATVIHHGRASTRQHPAASTDFAIGLVRYLRKRGYAAGTILFYKAIVTLDAPLTLVLKLVEYMRRRCFGKAEKAQKSRLAVRVILDFLRRLPEFWAA